MSILFHPLRLFLQTLLLEHSLFHVEVFSARGVGTLIKLPSDCRGTYSVRQIVQRFSA